MEVFRVRLGRMVKTCRDGQKAEKEKKKKG